MKASKATSKKPQEKAAESKDDDESSDDSSEDSSDNESDEEEKSTDVVMKDVAEKPAKSGKHSALCRVFPNSNFIFYFLLAKRKADNDVAAPAKKTKVANGDAVAADGQEESKTCFIGKLSWNVDNDWLATEFADCGEVVSARVQMDRNTGKSRGFGFVEFANVEGANAAVALNGQKEIDGRVVNIDKTTPKAPNPEGRAKVFGDTPGEPSTVLFVGNVSFDTTEDQLWEVFAEYGEVKSVRLPTDRESGRPKGFGYVEFTDIESSKKAFEGAKGLDIGGRNIRLDFSQPRADNGGGGGGGRGRGRGGFGGNDRGWVCLLAILSSSKILIYNTSFRADVVVVSVVGAIVEAGYAPF